MRRLPFTLFLIICCIEVGGCSSTYQRLSSQMQSPEHCDLIRAGDRMPHHVTRYPVQVAPAQTAIIAVHETRTQEAGPMLVLVPGMLSDSRMFRFLVGELGQYYNLLLIDPLGCGQSDAPDPASLPPDAYGPSSLAACDLQALRQHLQSHPSAEKIILVGHSLGGMVVLRMLSDQALRLEFGDVLSRVDGAVLFAPAHVGIQQYPEVFRAIRDTPDAAFAFATLSGLLRERVSENALQNAPELRLALHEEADQACEVLSDPHRRRAVKAMLDQAIPHQGDKPDYKRVSELARDYSRVSVPCLIVWGMQDQTLDPSIGYMFLHQLPSARMRLVRSATHSLAIERPHACAVLIEGFVQQSNLDELPVAYVDPETGQADVDGMPPSRAVVVAIKQ
jgi:pimeloyl-ACP methyl ester carboxylesterase